jgi:hypothetical protein
MYVVGEERNPIFSKNRISRLPSTVIRNPSPVITEFADKSRKCGSKSYLQDVESH